MISPILFPTVGEFMTPNIFLPVRMRRLHISGEMFYMIEGGAVGWAAQKCLRTLTTIDTEAASYRAGKWYLINYSGEVVRMFSEESAKDFYETLRGIEMIFLIHHRCYSIPVKKFHTFVGKASEGRSPMITLSLDDDVREFFGTVIEGWSSSVTVTETSFFSSSKEHPSISNVSDAEAYVIMPPKKQNLFDDISDLRSDNLDLDFRMEFLPSIHGDGLKSWSTVVYEDLENRQLLRIADQYNIHGKFVADMSQKVGDEPYIVYVGENGDMHVSDSSYFTYDTTRSPRTF